jgi:hypothetical protein
MEQMVYSEYEPMPNKWHADTGAGELSIVLYGFVLPFSLKK